MFKRHEDLFTAEVKKKKTSKLVPWSLYKKNRRVGARLRSYLKAKHMTLQTWLCIFTHSRRVGNRQETAALSKVACVEYYLQNLSRRESSVAFSQIVSLKKSPESDLEK